MDIHFACVKCGKCCRDTKIPLTVPEAVQWLDRGHQVQLACEASPWPEELAAGDPKAAYFKRRSFAVTSGTMPTRVAVMLVANVAGACPNLLDDMRCGIYADRPLVCRVYPAEINPLVELDPGRKACPPEAWTPVQPLLQRRGAVVRDELRHDIQAWRDTEMLEVELKRRLCVALNAVDVALVHEAVLVYPFPASTLASALGFAMASDRAADRDLEWRFVSDRSEAIEDLAAQGAIALHRHDAADLPFQYFSSPREPLFGPYRVRRSGA